LCATLSLTARLGGLDGVFLLGRRGVHCSSLYGLLIIIHDRALGENKGEEIKGEAQSSFLAKSLLMSLKLARPKFDLLRE